ncbi:MAG TPA: glycerophosphodiester phosphodiesterase family protein [Bryobacteraceae bacterium]|nr:glycerophosphodiester phosphodiesterase family protein [Bryobacteraceae bacterium]
MKPAVHGHRGARAVFPENTLPAFEYAIHTGVDAIELDVLATKDDVLVVTHDPLINADICRGGPAGIAVRDLTFDELVCYDCGSQVNPRFPLQRAVPGARIPSLDEVLDLWRLGDFTFNIEVKSFPAPEFTPSPDAYARLLLARLAAHRVTHRVLVQSFDFRVLASIRRIDPLIRLAALWEGPERDILDFAREAGTRAVSLFHELIRPDNVLCAHEAGIDVLAWTPNDEPAWYRLAAADVDAIITDDPAPLIEFLRSRDAA